MVMSFPVIRRVLEHLGDPAHWENRTQPDHAPYRGRKVYNLTVGSKDSETTAARMERAALYSQEQLARSALEDQMRERGETPPAKPLWSSHSAAIEFRTSAAPWTDAQWIDVMNAVRYVVAFGFGIEPGLPVVIPALNAHALAAACRQAQDAQSDGDSYLPQWRPDRLDDVNQATATELKEKYAGWQAIADRALTPVDWKSKSDGTNLTTSKGWESAIGAHGMLIGTPRQFLLSATDQGFSLETSKRDWIAGHSFILCQAFTQAVRPNALEKAEITAMRALLKTGQDIETPYKEQWRYALIQTTPAKAEMLKARLGNELGLDARHYIAMRVDENLYVLAVHQEAFEKACTTPRQIISASQSQGLTADQMVRHLLDEEADGVLAMAKAIGDLKKFAPAP